MKMKFEKVTAKQLKSRLRKSYKNGIALDIDDTLCYTDYHWIEQMMVKFGNPENLKREEIIAKYKWIEAVPYWQSKGAAAIIKTLMHSNTFQRSIPLIENSNRAVQRINKIISVIAYVTARQSVVSIGTISWLKKHGFPPAPIIFRPMHINHTKRNSWKAGLLKFLYPEVRGIIDDNPGLVRELRSMKYKGALYLYDNGKNTKQYKNTFRCMTWDDIYSLILKNARK